MGKVGVRHFTTYFIPSNFYSVTDLNCHRMWTSKLYVDPAHIAHADDDKFAKSASLIIQRPPVFIILQNPSAFARIENHYFVNEVGMKCTSCRDLLKRFDI